MYKKIVLALISVMMMAMLVTACGGNDKDAAGEDNSLQAIKDKGVLTLGCDDQFPPMGFVDEEGNLTGFDLDLAKGVAEELGVDLEVKAIDWKTKEMELDNGNIDVIWNGYSITAERDEKVEFTKPYLNNEQLIVVRADSNIKSVEDLKGKVLGVQSESAAEEALAKAINKDLMGSLKELRKYDTYQQAMLDLDVSDRIAGVAGDKVLVEYIMQQQPGKFMLLEGASLSTEYFGIGCRQGEIELREAIDSALDKMMEEGKIDKIASEWFDSNIVIRNVDKLTQEELVEMES